MPGSIKSLKRRPSAKSAAKRIGRMFKRTNSEDPEAIASPEPKDSFEGARPSTSSRYSTSSRMTTREDAESPSPSAKDQSRPFASFFDSRRQKESEIDSPHPLASANSEPVLETLGPADATKSVEIENTVKPEALTSPVHNELKMSGEGSEKQLEPSQQPENIEKKPEKKTEQTIEKKLSLESPPSPAVRPLPYPPAVQDTTEHPESPIIPTKDFRESSTPNSISTPEPDPEPKAKAEAELELVKQPIIPPPTVEDVAEESMPDVFQPKSPIPPRPTVEDEPEAVAEPVKETRAKAESKTESKVVPKVTPDKRQRTQPRDISPKSQLKGTKSKVEPKRQSKDESKTVHEKSIPVQSTPIAPKTTRKPAQAPSPRVAATSTTSASPKKGFVATTFSPKIVPGTSALSISFQPTRTVFVPNTAPAPYTARPPITAQAPMIATAPKVTKSMFAWAVPETASVPIIAVAPQRVY
ncbi:hypothetical protein ACHAPA_004225 [Fusarium lateritium]